MTRLDPLRPAAGTTIQAGRIIDTAAGRARYELTSGERGGPARYLQPAATATAGDPAHTHTPTAPPAGTPCLVIMIGGARSAAWVIPFPEEV